MKTKPIPVQAYILQPSLQNLGTMMFLLAEKPFPNHLMN